MAAGGKSICDFLMKNTKFLIIIFLLIVLFGWLAWWRFFSFQKALKEVSLPAFEMPQLELLPEEKDLGEKEYFTPDRKLKIKYPGSWTKAGDEFLRVFNQGRDELAEAKTLFVAYKTSWKNPFPSYLVCQEISLTDPEKIMEEIKKGSQAEIEIFVIEKKEEEILFEAVYKKEGSYLSLRSREKIISFPEKSYLVSVFTVAENWEKISSDVQFIFDSIKIFE